MAAELEPILQRLEADLTGLLEGYDKAAGAAEKTTVKIDQKFAQLGQSLDRVGKRLTLALTVPFTVAAGIAVKAADQQLQAENKLAAAIEFAGESADDQLEKFKEFASTLQSVTTVGDESTLANIQMAKSMGLSSQQSARASKNAIALAKAFGINERSAIRYTAALEQGDTTMLNRYIPSLRKIEDQTQRAAKAQELLSNAFGIAMREAQTGLGPMRQLSNSIGDLAEEFGKIILEAINPFVNRARVVVERLQGMSDETKKVLLIVGGIAAVIGPGLVALGALISGLGFAISGFITFGTTVATVVTGIGTAMVTLVTAVTSPIGLIIAALATATGAWFLFRDTIKAVAKSMVSVLKTTLVAGFRNNVERPFLQGINNMVEKLGVVGTAIRAIPTQFLPEKFRGVAEAIQKVVGGFEIPPEIKTNMPFEFLKAFAKIRDGASKDIARIKENFKSLKETISGLVPEGVRDELDGLFEGLDLDTEEIQEKLKGLIDDLPELPRAMGRAAEDTKRLKEAVKQVGSSLENAFERALIAGDSFRDVIAGIGDDIFQIFVRQAIAKPLAGALLGGLFGNNLVGSALGNAFHAGRVIPMARGGVLSGPTVFPMANGGVALGGEAGDEGLLPLKRGPGGTLGVHAFGQGRGRVEVNIFSPPGTEATQEQQQIGDLTKIDVIIDEITARNVRTQGTATQRSLTQVLGARTRSVRR